VEPSPASRPGNNVASRVADLLIEYRSDPHSESDFILDIIEYIALRLEAKDAGSLARLGLFVRSIMKAADNGMLTDGEAHTWLCQAAIYAPFGGEKLEALMILAMQFE